MKRNKFGKQYFTLLGGGVELGEDLEPALRRELDEEARMKIGEVRLVFIEEAGEPYGTQYIFLCDYVGGDPILRTDSEEALLSAGGQNTYEPMWMKIDELPGVSFVSEQLKNVLVQAFEHGFPEESQQI